MTQVIQNTGGWVCFLRDVVFRSTMLDKQRGNPAEDLLTTSL